MTLSYINSRTINHVVVESYNYDDYAKSLDLYNKMKESASGLDKFYTKKWFDNNYKFIKRQLEYL